MLLDNVRLLAGNGEEIQAYPDFHDIGERLSDAIDRTQDYFIGNQHVDGYWWFELESNVTITAEYLMLLHFAGIKDRVRDEKIANYILKQQRPDGTWAIHKNGRGDISTTVEAYFALKLAGYRDNDARLERARRFVVSAGGVTESRFFTKVFLALFGQYDWKAIPSVPVEIVLLPPWFPLNIYNFSSWARATLVPLSLVMDAKPVKVISPDRGVGELYSHEAADDRRQRPTLFSWKGVFAALDRVIKATEESRLRRFRKKGVEAALAWVLEHQEASGDWGGIQPAMINSVLALLTQGHGPSYGPIRKGLEALERFSVQRDHEMVLQSCISPVWDTALTALALDSSGIRRSHPAIARSSRWLAGKQIFGKGDWSVKRPDLEPGGWAFEFENNRYPDIDDTAVVLMLLRACGMEFLTPENMDKAVKWVLGMQGKDGGWGAFDVDNNKEVFNQIPFGDLEAMIDPSTADITGRTIELLGRLGYGPDRTEVKRAIRFLKKTQEKDGLWWGRWGVNYIYGTWSVLAGLQSVGEDMRKPYIRRAVFTLKRFQNVDGGWGECCESYWKPRLRMRGKSSPSQTAWVIMALIASGDGLCREVERGVQFLLKRQKPDATWDEDDFTATGFPKHFMIKYHNYRNCFPLMALGKYRALLEREGT